MRTSWRLARLAFLLLVVAGTARAQGGPPRRPNPPLLFEVGVAQPLAASPLSGRLFVVASPTERLQGRGFGRGTDSSRFEPRQRIGGLGITQPPVFARDVTGLSSGRPARIDGQAISFPIDGLWRLAPGEYFVQAILDTNQSSRGVNAPGNLYSEVKRVRLDPRMPDTVRLDLSKMLPGEAGQSERYNVKYVRIRSAVLSQFHRRDVFLRAGVILPRDYGRDPARRYPLRVHIGGYGSRYTSVARMMDSTSDFRRAWGAPDAPSFIFLHLDGDGPLGDPHQVDSDNNGPYGAAITQELIPYVERVYNGIGTPISRVLDGGSTGGWVSLALQVFYPDFFNGAWASCPDGVDFRAFQLVDVYADTNAYVNRYGFERASRRDLNGEVRFTMRHELQMENMLGAGDSWTMSGAQWGAWNATYGPRGADGRPVPLWDPRTGKIDRSVVAHWEKYDLRKVMEASWSTLGPKLQGKIHISVGDADDYFLNNGVQLLNAFLTRAQPRYNGSISFAPGRGHCWSDWSQREMMDQMAQAVGLRRR